MLWGHFFCCVWDISLCPLFSTVTKNAARVFSSSHHDKKTTTTTAKRKVCCSFQRNDDNAQRRDQPLLLLLLRLGGGGGKRAFLRDFVAQETRFFQSLFSCEIINLCRRRRLGRRRRRRKGRLLWRQSPTKRRRFLSDEHF